MRNRSIGLALLTLCLLIAPAAPAIEKETDLTNLFLAGGVDIDRLRVCEISGVVIIRGRTSDPARAAHAGEVAALLGFARTANLIEVRPALADDAIDRFAAVELRRARELIGCTFEVQTRRGVVYLLGEVNRDDQKGYAIRLIRRIDGVKEVKSGLTRSK